MSDEDKSFGEFIDKQLHGEGKPEIRRRAAEQIFGPRPQEPRKLHPMDELMLRKLGRLPVETEEETPEEAPQTGLSETQAARIEKYVQAGASYTGARDLVLKPPPAHAGNGTGGTPLARESLSDFIDAALRRAGRGSKY